MNEIVKAVWPWMKIGAFIVAVTAIVAVVYKTCSIVWNFIV